MSLLDRILACVDKIIPTLHNDSTKEWRKVTEEGKIVCEEIENLSERAKEAPDSLECPRFSQRDRGTWGLCKVMMLASFNSGLTEPSTIRDEFLAVSFI